MSIIDKLNEHLGKTPDQIVAALKISRVITINLADLHVMDTSLIREILNRQRVAYDEFNQRAVFVANRGYARRSVEGNPSTRNFRSEDFPPVVGSSRAYWATSAD